MSAMSVTDAILTALELMPKEKADSLRLDLARVEVARDMAHLQKLIDDTSAPEASREIASAFQAMFKSIADLLGTSAASTAATSGLAATS